MTPTSDSVETLRSQLDDAAKHIGEQRERIKALEAKLNRYHEVLKVAFVDIAWNEYNCGIERDGKWMDGALSDAELLQHDMGLEPGWHDAQMVKDLMPVVVAKRLHEALSAAERTGLVSSSPAKTEQSQSIADELVEVGEGAS